jgi:hypothetical protein
MSIVKNIVLLLSILLIAVISSRFFNSGLMENFDNFKYALGNYPSSENGAILPDTMFPTGQRGVSTCTANMIWRNYPIFEVGSYDQETNNIRYPRNPDEGTCMPADFCGALYKNRPYRSNVVKPLPPVPQAEGARINYYHAKTENMLPYYNEDNILY